MVEFELRLHPPSEGEGANDLKYAHRKIACAALPRIGEKFFIKDATVCYCTIADIVYTLSEGVVSAIIVDVKIDEYAFERLAGEKGWYFVAIEF